MTAKLIDLKLLSETGKRAQEAPRKRTNHNFHQPEEVIQRFINAIEPGSYVQPHRHVTPPKEEIFLLLQGSAAILLFDEQGEVTDHYVLDRKLGHFGIEIPPMVYHMLISLEEGTQLYEIKQGPYDPKADKGFAPWAPAEGDPGAEAYLAKLVERIKG